MLQRGWLLSQMMGEWEPSWHAAGEQPWASGTQGLLVHSSVTDLSLRCCPQSQALHKKPQTVSASPRWQDSSCLPAFVCTSSAKSSQEPGSSSHPCPCCLCGCEPCYHFLCVTLLICEMEVEAKSFTLQCNQEPVLAGFFRKQSHKQGPTCV